jgi:hypothetical protein
MGFAHEPCPPGSQVVQLGASMSKSAGKGRDACEQARAWLELALSASGFAMEGETLSAAARVPSATCVMGGRLAGLSLIQVNPVPDTSTYIDLGASRRVHNPPTKGPQ